MSLGDIFPHIHFPLSGKTKWVPGTYTHLQSLQRLRLVQETRPQLKALAEPLAGGGGGPVTGSLGSWEAVLTSCKDNLTYESKSVIMHTLYVATRYIFII